MRGARPGGSTMKLPRRTFLYLAAGAAALPSVSRVAWAQIYPTRPVRILVGFAAGQAIDILVRIVAQSLSDQLGQQFVIENRPGAGGNLAAEVVVRSPPDGHTLLAVGMNNMINATLYERLSFNFIRDIAPVGSILRAPQVMLVNPSVPARTMSEFITYAKANPGKINMASAGIGSPTHLSGELFKMMTGINMLHVPYRGSPAALTDLIAGQVQVMFDNVASSLEHIRTGRLRALAVTTTTRWEGLPDIPTVSDVVPGFETGGMAGIGAPKGTPPEIVGKLNKGINSAIADVKVKTRLVELGGTVLPGSPGDFEKLIAVETEKWAKVVKFSGAKAE
jgi:tripartite-type tricarboxylate transporter receptor subunit TctC